MTGLPTRGVYLSSAPKARNFFWVLIDLANKPPPPCFRRSENKGGLFGGTQLMYRAEEISPKRCDNFEISALLFIDFSLVDPQKVRTPVGWKFG